MFELKSVAWGSHRTLRMYLGRGDTITVTASEGTSFMDERIAVVVSKTELREGLAREFGWTIYDNADLPEVTLRPTRGSVVVDGEYYDLSPEFSEYRRKEIRQYLAVENYIDAHPQRADPADDIASIIWAASRADEGSISAMGAKVIANALLNSGKVVAQ